VCLNRGQGLKNVLKESAQIVDALKSIGKSFKDAIDAYEEEMHPKFDRGGIDSSDS
jgi:hypothetical protein